MGRRRIFNQKTDRVLNKIDPSGCLSCVLPGVTSIIGGIVFLCVDSSFIAAPIILILSGAFLVTLGIVRAINISKRNNHKNKDDSDYTEF